MSGLAWNWSLRSACSIKSRLITWASTSAEWALPLPRSTSRLCEIGPCQTPGRRPTSSWGRCSTTGPSLRTSQPSHSPWMMPSAKPTAWQTMSCFKPVVNVKVRLSYEAMLILGHHFHAFWGHSLPYLRKLKTLMPTWLKFKTLCEWKVHKKPVCSTSALLRAQHWLIESHWFSHTQMSWEQSQKFEKYLFYEFCRYLVQPFQLLLSTIMQKWSSN